MSLGSVSKYKVGATMKWRFQFRSETGHQIRRRGFDTKASAERAMDEEKRLHVGLIDPTSLSFGDYLERWLADRLASGALRQSTADSYRRNIKPAMDRFASVRLSALTPSHLDSLYQDLSTSGRQSGGGLSARTVRYTHTVLKKALSDAQRKGLISRNPADNADPPSASAARPKEPTIWSIEEVRRFSAAAWLPNYRRVAWVTALRTGLRRGELTALRWSALEGALVHVRSSRTTVGHEVIESDPKSQKSIRSIHIDPGLAEILRGWKAEQGRLSLSIGVRSEFVLTDALLQPWHPNAMTHAWGGDVKRAVEEGLVDHRMRLHDCRHWHATQLVAAGVDLNTVADRMGHATAAFTLSVYGHSDAERDEKAAATVGRVLDGG